VEGLEHVYAMIVPAAFANQLVSDFSQSSLKIDSIEFHADLIPQARPFDGMTFPSIKRDGINEQILRQTLSGRWQADVKPELQSVSMMTDKSAVPAVQMQSTIPLDYLRFLSTTKEARKLYIGGRPPEAGNPGLVYALCAQNEYSEFVRVLETLGFKELFYYNMYYVPAVDSLFLEYDPIEYRPASALILEAKTKFNPDISKAAPRFTVPEELMTSKERAQAHNKPVEEGADDELEYDEDTGPQKDKKVVKDTQHGLLQRIAKILMRSPVKRPGRLINGRLVFGDLLVHYSKDLKKAVLWGAKSQKVSFAPQRITSILDFIKRADTSYL
jgi:hypothetical protein